ncbi:conserved hypothetical protein [Perkinsus marinus ATCC 50983]|uniref:Cilia- and flagella-associated protein 43 n=1 Tax=Perkinsus marinus (strain ATCC 50983 / TXsc) TaxID=423536 RepID=C5LM98_PERM5|nr:conserved hypothetical protein [Perkinsus marinus ATCC 50983]EER02110.1 conserved hypothetical protein [Perkinsus marinus ATCC 50983]|eukprot:XP_002769392.1 conserved hypothetical protein [Perkinsus marinus ATCC 50983]
MTTPASGEPLKIDSMVGGADPPVFIEEATLAYCVGKVLCVWDTDTDECKYCRMPLDQEGSQQLYGSGQGQLVLSTEACDGAIKVLIYPLEAEGLGIATEMTVPVGEGCKGPTAVAMSPCCTRVFVMVGGPEEQYLAVYSTDTCKGHLLVATSTGLLLCLSIEQSKAPPTKEERQRLIGRYEQLISVHSVTDMADLGPIRHMFFRGHETLIAVHMNSRVSSWAFDKGHIYEPISADHFEIQAVSHYEGTSLDDPLVLVKSSVLSELTEEQQGQLKWAVSSPQGQTLWVCTLDGHLWSANMITEEVDTLKDCIDSGAPEVGDDQACPLPLAYRGSTLCGALDCITDIKVLCGHPESPTFLVATSSGAVRLVGPSPSELDGLPRTMYLQTSHAPINCLAVSATCRLVVAGSENGVVQTVDLGAGPSAVLNASRGLESSAVKLSEEAPVVDVSLTKLPCGREVCYARLDNGDVFLLTVREKTGLLTVVSHLNRIEVFAGALGGQEVSAACWCDHRLALAVTSAHGTAVLTVSFTIDRMMDGLLDPSGVTVATHQLPSASKVRAMVSCSLGLIAGNVVGEVALYSLPSELSSNLGELPLVRILYHGNRPISRLSMDGVFVVAATSDGSVHALSLANGHTSTVEDLHTKRGGVTAVAVSGQRVASGRGRCGLALWYLPEKAGTTVSPSVCFTKMAMVPRDASPTGVQPAGVVNDDELEVWSIGGHRRQMDEAVAVRRSLDGREAQRVQLVHEVQAKMAQLRERLKSIVEKNQSGPEEERLERDEFCVDFEAREEVALECERKSHELREKLKEEIAARAVFREQLVKEFWEPMGVHMAQLHCIEEGKALRVANYPFRSSTSAADSGNPLLRKLRVLRDVQARESMWLTGCSLLVEDDALSPFRQGRRLGTAESSGAVEETGKPSEADSQGVMERTASSAGGSLSKDPGLARPCFPALNRTCVDFLYHPMELVSSPRKRIQASLLEEVSMEYKRAFNKAFEEVKDERAKAVEHISELVHRIHAILKELKSDEDPPMDPAARHLETDENPESVLEVLDREIHAEKWISKEERARLVGMVWGEVLQGFGGPQQDAEAAAEAERLRKLQEDDGGRQKALITMMGGTLRTKKDLSPLEIRLDREEWMDIVPEEEMDEDQKAAFAEQLAREKTLAEEQEAYRTRLAEELGQLKAEIKKEVAAFDDGLLKKLYRARVETDLKIHTQELLVLQNRLALRQSVEDKSAVERLNLKIAEVRKKVAECRAEFDDFSLVVRELEREADEIVRQERDCVSLFKQQFSTAKTGIDTEAFNQLLVLFRTTLPGEDGSKMSHNLFTRQPSRVLAGSVPAVSEAPSSYYYYVDTMDDYELQTPSINDIATFKYAEDCPEEIDEELFDRAMILRQERHEMFPLFPSRVDLLRRCRLDLDVRRMNALIDIANRRLWHHRQRWEKALSDEKALLEQLGCRKRDMLEEKFDTAVIMMIKQGLINMPEGPVVTDCTDAIIVPAEETIETRNRHIMTLAEEKLAVLHKIKEFRKKLKQVEWEQAVLKLEREDLEEHSRDIQMMRVTKDLRTALSESNKKPSERQGGKEVEIAMRKLIERIEKSGMDKEAALAKELELAKKRSEARRRENAKFERKLDDLREVVAEREEIRDLGDSRNNESAESSTVYRPGEKRIPIGGGGRIEENYREVKEAHARFAESRVHREQMDMARIQAREIQKCIVSMALRAVLEDYHQRTFPTFVHVHQPKDASNGQ